ncbi:hypothetical protein SAMN05444363_0960 [Flavobacterium terrae]|uniref:Uncharacterized protein n=1 Tax=Flavobacterium terrae TaxID=415425 RepID=A0A1M6CJZ0_9FLAO|nr:hypothetical protein SAMN05444363_0960 [Flavobacterium terrae]
MAKLYTKKKNETQKMLPKQETVDFILNYSKALRIVKTTNNENFEIVVN